MSTSARAVASPFGSRSRRRTIAAVALAAAGVVLAVGRGARATGLDPFRWTVAPTQLGQPARRSLVRLSAPLPPRAFLSPIGWHAATSRAAPAPRSSTTAAPEAAVPRAPARRLAQAEAAPGAPAARPPPVAAPVSAPHPTVNACTEDADCPEETICEGQFCRRIEHRVNVFFLYYQDGTFREVLGLYWSKRGPSGYKVLFPLYWSYFAPRSRSRIVAPFYWHFEDDAAHTATTVIVPGLPVSWTRGPGAHSFAIWPLFYASNKFGWAAPLLASFAIVNPERGRSFGAIALLYWWKRTPRSAFDLGIPLFVSLRSPSSAFTYALPLNFYRRSGASWFATAFPLWWGAGNTETGWRFQMLLPFYFAKHGEHGRSFTLITPLGGYSRDDDTRSRALTLWPLLSYFRRDDQRSIDVITPFYVGHHDHEADSRTHLLGLLLYLRDDPEGSTSVVFPVFWHFRDAATEATGTLLFPFAYHRSGPGDSSTYAGIFPLWFFHRRLADGGRSTGLFPLVFFGHRGAASHAVVVPFLWHFADEKRTTTAVLPLFFATRGRAGSGVAAREASAVGILPLLAFWGRDRGGSSYQIQFPLFWRFADAKAGRTTTVTPLGFFGTSPPPSPDAPRSWRLGVGPLLPIVWAAGGGPRRHLVVFPVLWHFADDSAAESSTLATLFFHRRRGGETTDALFPLFYYRRGARGTGADDQATLTVFPFFHYHRRATEKVWISPIAGAAEGPTRAAGFVGPYLWYRGPGFVARGIPLLYADVLETGTHARTRQWGPFVALDGPGRSTRVLLPLYGRYQDAHERDTYVFPTFFRQRRDDGYAVDAFLPLFWRSSWKDHTATVVGPWYRREAPHVLDTGVAPFFFWAKSADRTALFIPPLLTFHRHDFRAATSFTWAALFFHRSGPESARTIVFPLWWSGERRGRADAGLYRVLIPVYFHGESTVARSAWTLVPLLYWSTHGSDRTRALWPLAWYSRDARDGSGTEALLPLFYTAHGPHHFTLFTAIAGIRRAPGARSFYIGPLYVSDTSAGSSRAFFPLFYSHDDRATQSRTRFFLPLLHYAQERPRKSLSTWAALFWRRTDVTSATTVVVPLFYDVHDYRQKRTTALLPLFLRHANEVTGESFWVLPLFYRHALGSDTTSILFPLVWDFKHADRRTTLVLPFFAHWTRSTYAGTYVFPNVYYRKGFLAPGDGAPAGEPPRPDGTWRLLIPPLFEAAVARPGDFSWEVLGGLFGKERIGRNHYLKLFFFTIETKKAAPSQTAWYGQPTRPSRIHAARGVSTNIW